MSHTRLFKAGLESIAAAKAAEVLLYIILYDRLSVRPQ
jgi:hypothetical protein